MSQSQNLFQRARLYLTQLRWAGKYTERYAADHCMWFDRMLRVLQPYIPEFKGIRALDIGCGVLLWQTIMLYSLGSDVTGVDMEYVRSDRFLDKYWQIWRSNGVERALKTAFWDYVYAGRYYRALQNCSQMRLNRKGLDVRQHSAEYLPFEDNLFDLVVSHEVFEHIADVRGAADEVKRVLKLGGMAYINIHLFPSISGGHHMEWKFPDEEPSGRVPPWDHLRRQEYPERPSWVNQLRESDYRPIFEEKFEILCWEASAYEGRVLLSPEIKAELPDYTEEDLLKKGIIILVRKVN